jgi:hypothetical protein
MIRKSVQRFSEKIMRKTKELKRDDDSSRFSDRRREENDLRAGPGSDASHIQINRVDRPQPARRLTPSACRA